MGTLLAPLDAARAAFLRALGRPLARYIADPEARVAVLGPASLAIALLLACATPRLLLLFGPLLLGVPHLVADLRYLVVGHGLHRRPALVALALVPCVAALVAPTLAIAGMSVVGAAIATRGPALRRAAVALFGATLVALGLETGRVGAIVFAHLHNAIAFGWLVFGFTRGSGSRRGAWWPTCVAALAASALGLGALPLHALAFDARFGDAELLRASLSPTSSPELADRFVVLFAFGQAAHYGVWLRLVPEFARPRRAPRSFASSYLALRDELGRPLLLLATLGTLMVSAGALVDAPFARDAYLRFALFHGPLELAVAAVLAIESERAWMR